jgi:hypothetical protein
VEKLAANRALRKASVKAGLSLVDAGRGTLETPKQRNQG